MKAQPSEVESRICGVFGAEQPGNDKGDSATRMKCAVATKRNARNWRAVFSSHCVYPVCLLASHHDETGFLRVGVVPDDAAGRRVFSRISRIPRPFIPPLLHTQPQSPSSVHKTSLLRAVQIYSLTLYAERTADLCSGGSPAQWWPQKQAAYGSVRQDRRLSTSRVRRKRQAAILSCLQRSDDTQGTLLMEISRVSLGGENINYHCLHLGVHVALHSVANLAENQEKSRNFTFLEKSGIFGRGQRRNTRARERNIPEKTRRPAASSGTRLHRVSSRWEVSSLIITPPRPLGRKELLDLSTTPVLPLPARMAMKVGADVCGNSASCAIALLVLADAAANRENLI
ncbi:hypothetical protein PR048_010569 [Dryococelus australis]|uniref:Uncharacterized protein n=1 Tax=Dryococelus australis TaxID=614101 RepID=A0ABQ9I314_9NEOP|nr:hypothetical protein PR048_010569 [Dryococelus australis]